MDVKQAQEILGKTRPGERFTQTIIGYDIEQVDSFCENVIEAVILEIKDTVGGDIEKWNAFREQIMESISP